MKGKMVFNQMPGYQFFAVECLPEVVHVVETNKQTNKKNVSLKSFVSRLTWW